MQKQKPLDPIYFTDDYPRNGCRIVISISEDNAEVVSVAMLAPEKYGSHQLLESYAPKSMEIAMKIAADLFSGRRVPRHYNSGGYSTS
ncbi:hypothetical protein [uncultured Desulfuromusa sp.]|uniref:hypothetical protein n=1 Tax=uncultured Desulfuromusa sp. TaxID=219183 RepID=UPI002AA67B28|nr:hypothetical protein [uncultured Desulfuromusa sp.]